MLCIETHVMTLVFWSIKMEDAVDVTQKYNISINNDESIKYFTLIREYMKHEDDLINNRTTWLNTIQSFLIAAFGITFQKSIELLSSSANKIDDLAIIRGYQYLSTVFSLVGIGTSIIAWYAILAAVNSINALRDKWSTSPYYERHKDFLPGIVGGGHPGAHEGGTRFALWLPRFFLVFWIIIEFSILTGSFMTISGKH